MSIVCTLCGISSGKHSIMDDDTIIVGVGLDFCPSAISSVAKCIQGKRWDIFSLGVCTGKGDTSFVYDSAIGINLWVVSAEPRGVCVMCFQIGKILIRNDRFVRIENTCKLCTSCGCHFTIWFNKYLTVFSEFPFTICVCYESTIISPVVLKVIAFI